MMTGRDVVERARSFVGRPFRPQGRDPERGLDCIGLVLAVYRIEPQQVRRDYRLRGSHRSELETQLPRFFRPTNAPEAGDVFLCEIARTQMHLAIHCGDTFVHADARLRRVVETPGRPCWSIKAVFRHPSLIQD
jgi:cell wall-associated NlpC family hydrolase